MGRVSLVALAACFGLLIISSLPFAAGTSTGLVVDTSGKPIPNAEVTALQWSDQGPSTARTLTDSRGRFVYTPREGSGANLATYLAIADGYSWGMSEPGGAPGKPNSTITLFREQKLRGKVVDEQGRPLPGVRITIERTQSHDGRGRRLMEFNFDASDWHISEATTRRDGTFVLNHLPSPEDLPYGYVRINARAQGRAMATRHIEQRNITEEPAITLPRECALAGVLYLPDRTGPAPEGTSLVLVPVDGGWGTSREFLVGKDGRFLVSQLGPGAYRLVTGPNFMSGSRSRKGGGSEMFAPDQPDWVLPAQEISIASDEAKIVELVATRGAMIEGRVVSTDDGLPVPDAIAAAVHAGRPEGTIPTCSVTNEKGEFALRVAAGDVTVRIIEAGRRTLQREESPTVTFKIAEDEQKADIVLRVRALDPSDSDESPGDSRDLAESVGRKPITKNLVLKTGAYELKWDPSVEAYHAMGWGLEPKKDEDVRKLMSNVPKLASEKPRYLAFKFDGEDTDGLLLAIMDESHSTGTGYDTVYFDLNRNADLSDDEPVKMPRKGDSSYTYSKWADALLYEGRTDGAPGHSYTAPVRLRYYYSTNMQDIGLQRKGAWRGKIDSNKGPLDCVLMTGYDLGRPYGRHTTRVDIYGSGTGNDLYIDTNGHGSASVTYGGPHRVRLDVPTKVADRYYDIDASKTGDRISIRPYAGKLGQFSVTSQGISGFAAKPTELKLYNDHGERAFDLSRGPALLPPGTYKMGYVTFDLENKKGERTTIKCLVHDKLVVRPGQTTSVDISGKISLEIAPRARYVTLLPGENNGIDLRAKIGEKVTVVVIAGRMITTLGCCDTAQYFPLGYSSDNLLYPRVDLFDKSGKPLFSGKSTGHYTDSSWLRDPCAIKLPALEPGIRNLRVTVDTKSPLGVLVARKEAILRDIAYRVLADEYEKTLKAGDLPRAEGIKKEILDKYFTWRIQSGKPYEVSYRGYGEYPTKDKLSAIVTWYAEKDHIRAVVDVTDAYFSTEAYENAFHRISSIQFFIDPSGTGRFNHGFRVVPKGKNGVPEVQTSQIKDKSTMNPRYERTYEGYRVSIRIPLRALPDYSPNWKVLPVGLMLNARTGKDRTQLQFTQSTEVYYDPRGWAALVAPK